MTDRNKRDFGVLLSRYKIKYASCTINVEIVVLCERRSLVIGACVNHMRAIDHIFASEVLNIVLWRNETEEEEIREGIEWRWSNIMEVSNS